MSRYATELEICGVARELCARNGQTTVGKVKEILGDRASVRRIASLLEGNYDFTVSIAIGVGGWRYGNLRQEEWIVETL